MKTLPAPISRRRFLRNSALVAGVCAARQLSPQLLASPRSVGRGDTTPRALVVIQLAGGNDGFNTVVPFYDDNYHHLRPTLALARRDLVFLNETLALNRACAAFEPLFKDGKLAIIDGVGYSQPSLSHFRASEIWQTASAADEVMYSGWAGRCFSSARPGSAFHSMASLPRLFTREEDRVNLKTLAVSRERLSATSQDPAACLSEVGERVGNNGTPEIYFISMPGFDTHSRQAEVHAGRLLAMSSALSAFQHRLEQRGVDGRVMTMVFSEFGRSAAENLQGGTDHGGAGPVFLLGSSVRGGSYHDHYSQHNPFALEGPSFDFQRIVQTVTTRWLGVPAGVVFERDPGEADFLLS